MGVETLAPPPAMAGETPLPAKAESVTATTVTTTTGMPQTADDIAGGIAQHVAPLLGAVLAVSVGALDAWQFNKFGVLFDEALLAAAFVTLGLKWAGK